MLLIKCIKTLGNGRMTSFDTKLKLYFSNDDTEEPTEIKNLILTEENMYEVDPMINMQNKTPYDFMK